MLLNTAVAFRVEHGELSAAWNTTCNISTEGLFHLQEFEVAVKCHLKQNLWHLITPKQNLKPDAVKQEKDRLGKTLENRLRKVKAECQKDQ